MRRIFEFLIAKRVFILFLILEIFALSMVFNFNGYHRASFVNNANVIGSSLHRTQTSITNYFNLKEQNAQLQVQNRGLLQNKRDRPNKVILDSSAWANTINLNGFEVINANIIYNTVNRPSNTFVIDKGYRQGVKNGLGIASAGGVIGKVIKTNRNYSLCLSILNTKSVIVMPKIAELDEKSGTVEWDGLDPKKLQLKGVHKFEEVKKGFHLVSSGFSQNFPENIPVGTLSSVKTTNGSYYKIEVKLAADLTKDKHVYLFKNLRKPQIDSLLTDPINENL